MICRAKCTWAGLEDLADSDESERLGCELYEALAEVFNVDPRQEVEPLENMLPASGRALKGRRTCFVIRGSYVVAEAEDAVLEFARVIEELPTARQY